MTTKHWTLIIFATCLFAFVGWDIWMAVNPAEGDTLSELVYGLSQKTRFFGMVLCWTVGVIMGHLLWGQACQKKHVEE